MSSVVGRPGQAASLVISIGLLSVLGSARAITQTPPPSWAGWARCQVDVQGPGYTERQIHTWASNGGAPTVEGAFRVYQGTWSVVGGGSLQRTQGTQALVAQWAINRAMTNAPLAVFVRASDGRLLLQARHAQLRAAGAVAGYQQQIIDGKPQTPGRLSADAFEFAFPLINAPATDKSVSGTSTPPVNGSVGFMQVGGSQVTASCSWTFGEGTATPAPPPALAAVPVPAATTTVSSGAPAPPVQSGQAPPVAVALPPGVATLTVVPTAVALPPSVPTLTTAPTATAVPPALASAVPLCTLRPPSDWGRDENHFSPVTAYLKWGTVQGATAYEVMREDLGLLGTVQATTTATHETYTHRGTLTPGTTYKYGVKAIYPQGCGIIWFDAKATAPAPFVKATMEDAAGAVTISWNVQVPDAHALIVGPGLPSGGQQSNNFVAYTFLEEVSAGGLGVVGIPRGNQTWTVTAIWGTGPAAVKSAPATVTFMVP